MTNENYKGLSFSYDSSNPQKPKTQVLEYKEQTDEYVVLHYSEKEIMSGPVVRNLIEAERKATNQKTNEKMNTTSKIPTVKSIKDDKWTSTILHLKGTYHKYYAGHVPKGEEAVKEAYGPRVPGPWAYTFHKTCMITNDSMEVKNAQRAEEDARTVVVEDGDLIELAGEVYKIRKFRGESTYLDLDLVSE